MNEEEAIFQSGDCGRHCFVGFDHNPDKPECCDNVWLPTVYIRNLYKFYIEDTGAPVSSAISVDYKAKQVVWMQHIRASFFAKYDFRAFPFDRQALVIEFEPRSTDDGGHNTVLAGSAIVYDSRPVGISEDINGWYVERANQNYLFWRAPQDPRDSSAVPIKCQNVIWNHTEGDASAAVVDQLSHQMLHNSAP